MSYYISKVLVYYMYIENALIKIRIHLVVPTTVYIICAFLTCLKDVKLVLYLVILVLISNHFLYVSTKTLFVSYTMINNYATLNGNKLLVYDI